MLQSFFPFENKGIDRTFPSGNGLVPQLNLVLPRAAIMVHKVVSKDLRLTRDAARAHHPFRGRLERRWQHLNLQKQSRQPNTNPVRPAARTFPLLRSSGVK